MVLESEERDVTTSIECPVLVTERLVLRPPHPDDIPELAQLANNRRVAEMLARMPHPYSEADAADFVRGSRSREIAAHGWDGLPEYGAFAHIRWPTRSCSGSTC